MASFALGHFAEQHGIHYVSLAANDQLHDSTSSADGMPEGDAAPVMPDDHEPDTDIDQEGETGKNNPSVSSDAVPIVAQHCKSHDDTVVHDQADEDSIEQEGETGENSPSVSADAISTVAQHCKSRDDHYPVPMHPSLAVLPDEILEMIVDYTLSGLCLVNTYGHLYNVCRRFRRIVMTYQRRLPQVHMCYDMAPGFYSMFSLLKRFGRGSGIIDELKDIIDSKRWLYAWVSLLFTGKQAWMCVRHIKWKRKER